MQQVNTPTRMEADSLTATVATHAVEAVQELHASGRQIQQRSTTECVEKISQVDEGTAMREQN